MENILPTLALIPFPLTMWCVAAYSMATPENFYDGDYSPWDRIKYGSQLMFGILLILSAIGGFLLLIMRLFFWGISKMMGWT